MRLEWESTGKGSGFCERWDDVRVKSQGEDWDISRPRSVKVRGEKVRG